MDKAAELKEDTGCYFQVNASSVAGDQGLAVKNVVKLLKMEMVDFAATDAHSDGNRAPRMKKMRCISGKEAWYRSGRKAAGGKSGLYIGRQAAVKQG